MLEYCVQNKLPHSNMFSIFRCVISWTVVTYAPLMVYITEEGDLNSKSRSLITKGLPPGHLHAKYRKDAKDYPRAPARQI